KNPVGSGPFKLVRWVKDDRIELEANEQYWRSVPRVKRLVFKPIPDDSVRVAALQNGEGDVAVNIPPHLAGVIANHPKLFLSSAASTRTSASRDTRWRFADSVLIEDRRTGLRPPIFWCAGRGTIGWARSSPAEKLASGEKRQLNAHTRMVPAWGSRIPAPS